MCITLVFLAFSFRPALLPVASTRCKTFLMLVMLSARSAVSSAYVRFVMFLPPILIPMSSGFGQVKIMKELILINRKLILAFGQGHERNEGKDCISINKTLHISMNKTLYISINKTHHTSVDKALHIFVDKNLHISVDKTLHISVDKTHHISVDKPSIFL